MHHVTIELQSQEGDTLSDLVTQLDCIKEQLLEGKNEGHDAESGRYAFECESKDPNQESDLKNGLHRPKPLMALTVTYTPTGESRLFLIPPSCYKKMLPSESADQILTAHVDQFRKYDNDGYERDSPLALCSDGKYGHYLTRFLLASTHDRTFRLGLSPSDIGFRSPRPSDQGDHGNNDYFQAWSAQSIHETLDRILEKSDPSNPEHFDTKTPVMFFHRDFSGNEQYFHGISIGGGDDHRAIEITLRECNHPQQYTDE